MPILGNWRRNPLDFPELGEGFAVGSRMSASFENIEKPMAFTNAFWRI